MESDEANESTVECERHRHGEAYAVECEAIAVTREALVLQWEAGGLPFPGPGLAPYPDPHGRPLRRATLHDLQLCLRGAIRICEDVLEERLDEERLAFVEEARAALVALRDRLQGILDEERGPSVEQRPQRPQRPK